MSDPKLPELLTTEEVAAWLRTSVQAVYNMRLRGELPQAVRRGKRLLFDRADLVRWMDAKRAPSPSKRR
jgi:excisionase family DNA binding protein